MISQLIFLRSKILRRCINIRNKWLGDAGANLGYHSLKLRLSFFDNFINIVHYFVYFVIILFNFYIT